MQDYDEKRSAVRMMLNCPVTYRIAGETQVHTGVCKNLSVDGIQIATEHAPAEGTVLNVNVAPDTPGVNPLNAEVIVKRVAGATDGQGYIVAGTLRITAEGG